ncbi:MAG: hypothetical protein R3209_03850 [Salinimicrobium sediminis]|jgi:hypothetical protein|uniref:hypothetical protein n=1 Tax=Salinimicrobium sp. GXAS 041 TaxID=3400806 RepID=UPI001F40E338|nr:hypothetical protein [Salinimicrobium sediminis]
MNDFLTVLLFAAMPALGNFGGGMLAEFINVSGKTVNLYQNRLFSQPDLYGSRIDWWFSFGQYCHNGWFTA